MIFKIAKGQKFFREKRMELYSYVSESGAPMVGDVYSLFYPRKAMDVAHEIADMVGFPEKFIVRDINSLHSKVQKHVKLVEKARSAESIKKLMLEERVFLGSSAKPVLTKKKAIEAFRDGASVEEVQQQFRGWSKKPLAQWKAHLTMGTYDKKSVEEEANGDLEKISKDDALELLSTGIPVKEIHEAYPSSFSVGQLRAFKAHMTMGTY